MMAWTCGVFVGWDGSLVKGILVEMPSVEVVARSGGVFVGCVGCLVREIPVEGGGSSGGGLVRWGLCQPGLLLSRGDSCRGMNSAQVMAWSGGVYVGWVCSLVRGLLVGVQ